MTDGPLTAARILVFTGPGKGKTTAAMGMALRAAGHGLRVRIMQFVKSDPTTGEIAAFRRFDNVSIDQCGLGFVPKPTHPRFAAHREAAGAGLATVANEIRAGRWDVVVLDELCVAVAEGLVPEADLLGLLAALPAGMVVALSGRGATAALIEVADTVTEMCCIKHGFDVGWSAQRGVEN